MLEDTDRLINTVEQVLRAGHLGQKSGKTFSASTLPNSCATAPRWPDPPSPSAGKYPLRQLHAFAAFVHGDPEELRSAINNLLEKRSSTLPARSPSRLKSSTKLTICWSGQRQRPGHSARRTQAHFPPLLSVNERLRQRVKGTGLGLFIVRSIAQRHGGSAYASSEGEGRGATVTLRLPRDSA